MTKFFAPIFFILISQAAGIIGSLFTASAIPTWYTTLNKPAFNPPSWVFGPAWIILYTLMGLAAYLVYLKLGSANVAKGALILFFVHLVVNALWSVVFFGFKNPMLAFVVIIVLWLMILALILLYAKIDKRAAYLMVPYILWVTFASVLNFSIWQLN